MAIEIVSTPDFEKDVKQLKRRFRRIGEDIRALLTEMENSEYRGVPMSGYGKALYKVRLTNRSARRGKIGGFRAIYFPDTEGRFIFVHVYSKTDQNDASASEIIERIKDIK